MAIKTQTRWSWTWFLVLLPMQLWLAHAAVFFVHEYAHSFAAWALGWKANPFLLHVPPLSLKILLLQLGIDQGVDEAAMFAAGHSGQAALVSASGVLGNFFITLPLGWLVYTWAKRTGRAARALLGYWVVVASVGNLLDYVPIRTFTDGNDLSMDTYAVELGLHWSPMILLLVAGIPFLFVMLWFFLRMEHRALRSILPLSRAQRSVCVVVTAFVMFCFYGAAGWSDAGPVSHQLSVISVCVLFPVTAIATLWLVERKPREA